MIKINGDIFEGGGQILRTALALSIITNKPFEIDNIRKGRPKPGLKAQHLNCIEALKLLTDSKADTAKLGSETLIFHPNKIKTNSVEIDIGTAGSITLLLQSLLLPCIHSDKTIKIKIIGGTDVKWSPSIDYFHYVFLPQMNHYAETKLILTNRGYFPKGKGSIELIIKPKKDKEKINLTKNRQLHLIKGISHASADLQKNEVAERQSKTAALILKSLNHNTHISTEYRNTESPGSGITLWARFGSEIPIVLGADCLGEKNKKAEDVGKEAANKLKELINKNQPIDPYLADQLIPFIAIFGGKIKTSKITQHALANAHVCNLFLENQIEINEEECTIINPILF